MAAAPMRTWSSSVMVASMLSLRSLTAISPFRLRMRLPHYRALIALAAVLAGCSAPSPPEEAVRAWLEAAETAVEERDRGRLIDMLAEHYVDARGNDRAAVDQRLRLFFLRHREILIASHIEELQVVGGTAAHVVLTAGMAGTDAHAFGLRADAYRFELEFVEQDGEWLLIGADWRPL